MNDYAAKALAGFTLALASSGLAAQTPTLRASTTLVTVDVTVTGKGNQFSGKEDPFLRGLTCADFQLQEANVPQTLQHCEEHHAGAVPAAQAIDKPLPPNVFSNNSSIPMPPALDIILVDFLNTNVAYTNKLKSQARDLILAAAPGHRSAVFALTGEKLVLLSGFTDDLRALQAAEKSVQQSTNGTFASSGSTSLAGMANYVNNAAVRGSLKAMAMDERIRDTRLAFDAIAAYTAELPGRKNLLWLTGAFPLEASRSQDDYTSDLYGLSRDLAAKRIAISPIDVRGVIYNGNDASRTLAGPSLATETDERSTMDNLAAWTGGKAFYGSNDIQGMVQKALQDGGDFYTLTYRPTNLAADGKFRTFKIVTTTKGAHLRYRPGYYAAPPPAAPMKAGAALTPDTSAAPIAVNPSVARVSFAMQRGIPDSTSILFFAEVNRGSDPNKISQQPYNVDYQIDPADLTWTTTAGSHTAELKMLLVAYDVEAAVLGRGDHAVHLKLTDEQYQHALTKGIHVRQTIDLPIGREAFLRLGVLDTGSSRIGTVEVPTASIRESKVPAATRP